MAQYDSGDSDDDNDDHHDDHGDKNDYDSYCKDVLGEPTACVWNKPFEMDVAPW